MDFVARRYGCLPSKIVEEGNSFDIQCALLGIKYQNHLNTSDKDGTVNHGYSEKQLLEMVNRVKGSD